jgi:hypothetical protein
MHGQKLNETSTAQWSVQEYALPTKVRVNRQFNNLYVKNFPIANFEEADLIVRTPF